MSTRELSITGTFEAGSFMVDHLHGTETLSEPFIFEVDLISPSPNVDISSLVGQTVAIGVDVNRGSVRYFNGYVSQASLVGIFDAFARYHITLRPWLFLLSARKNNRIFQNKS